MNLPWWIWPIIFVAAFVYKYRSQKLAGFVIRRSPPPDRRRPRQVPVRDLADPKREFATTLVGQGEHAGWPWEARHFAGDAGTPPFLVLSLLVDSNCGFGVFRKSASLAGSRVARALGTDLTSGDAAFNQEFRIRALGTTGPAAQCLRSPEWRDAVRALFASGFNMVRSDGTGFDVVWTSYPADQPPEPLVLPAVEQLARLIPPNARVEPYREPGGQLGLYATILVAVVLLFVLMRLIPLAEYRAEFVVPAHGIGRPLLGAAVAALLVATGLTLLLRRRLARWTVLTLFLATSIVSFVYLAVGVALLNARLDTGPASINVQRATGFETRAGRPFALVTPLHGGHSEQRVPVTPELYSRLTALAASHPDFAFLELQTRPGFFGIEWIAGATPLWPTSAETE